jgi:hypothetical protein
MVGVNPKTGQKVLIHPETREMCEVGDDGEVFVLDETTGTKSKLDSTLRR